MLTILQARQALKLSQQDLANALGVTQGLLSHYETGRSPVPKYRREKIMRLLRTQINFNTEELPMFGNVPDAPKPVWNSDGKPDYSALDGNEERLKTQIEAKLLEEVSGKGKPGEKLWVQSVKPTFVIFAANSKGTTRFYKQSYSIDEYEDVVLEGDRTFVEVEDPRNFVPNMATGKYTRGKFVVNDDDEDPVSHQDHIPDQLVDLLSPLHAMDSEKGEYLNLDEITEDSVIARFELSGGYLLYKANFTVDEDGKVSLVGTPTRIKDTIGTLSRKRTVPEMPAPRWRKDGRPDFSDLD